MLTSVENHRGFEDIACRLLEWINHKTLFDQPHLVNAIAMTLEIIICQDSEQSDTVSPGGVVELVWTCFCRILSTKLHHLSILFFPRYLPFLQHILRTAFFQSDKRIGEASHPGPPTPGGQGFRIAFVNPTTVLNREAAFDNLKVDCLALAETSATKLTQQQVTFNMKQRGYATLWREPVDNHKTTLCGQDSLRGQASGVAFMAKVPLKPFRNANPPTALQRTRVHFAYAQYGATTILQCVLYGLANGNDRARETTNALVAYAVEIILAHHGPAIVCGDFNHDLSQLPAVQLLQQAGFLNIMQIHQNLYGKPMPPTYKEQSTSLMLFSTEIAGHVTSIEILQFGELPGHKPVIINLDLPGGGLTKRMWQAPKNWQELSPDQQLVEHCYSQLPSLEITPDSMSNLQQWSNKVEKAVDAALRNNICNNQITFPCRDNHVLEYQGRFRVKTMSTKHFRCFAPKARQGDYEPFTEVKTIQATQLIRQLRRLQSLRRRMHRDMAKNLGWA